MSRERVDPVPAAGARCEYPGVQTRVLIVDDHASFRSIARRVLVADGFLVVGEAADGAEAISRSLRAVPGRRAARRPAPRHRRLRRRRRAGGPGRATVGGPGVQPVEHRLRSRLPEQRARLHRQGGAERRRAARAAPGDGPADARDGRRRRRAVPGGSVPAAGRRRVRGDRAVGDAPCAARPGARGPARRRRRGHPDAADAHHRGPRRRQGAAARATRASGCWCCRRTSSRTTRCS